MIFPRWEGGAILAKRWKAGRVRTPDPHFFLGVCDSGAIVPGSEDTSDAGTVVRRGRRLMASERQIAANRQNARRSSGPKSEAGRRRISSNALRHGLSRSIDFSGGAEMEALARCIVGDAADAEIARTRTRSSKICKTNPIVCNSINGRQRCAINGRLLPRLPGDCPS